MAVAYASREQIEVYRFNPVAAVVIPLAAIILQAFLPLIFPWASVFDFPLLIVIYFAVARRSQVTGLLTGCAIGLVQDSITHQPIGLYGMANTIVGFGASSLGVKLDVDNPGSRALMTLGFYMVHQFVYYSVGRGLVGQDLIWRWGHEAMAGIANALLAVFLFAVLDKFRQRT